MIFVAKLKTGEEITTVALDATSYTEAEILANRVGAVICSSGFTVDSIVKTQFKEVLESAMISSSTDSRFYKAKVVAMEETASGKEKPKRYLYLVRATSIKDALSEANVFCESFVSDTRTMGLEESDVTEFYDVEAVKELESVSLEV